MTRYRIAILDADDVSRAGLELLVTKLGEPFQVVGTFSSATAFSDYPGKDTLHLLLLDDDLPQVPDMPALVQELKAEDTLLRILLLGKRIDPRHVKRLIRAGARGYVLKEERFADKLSEALHTVLQEGALYVSPKLALPLFERASRSEDHPLTHRERMVLQLMEQGFNVQEIATRLGVSDRAVYHSRNRLREKLEVRTTEQIVGAAIALDLIKPTRRSPDG